MASGTQRRDVTVGKRGRRQWCISNFFPRATLYTTTIVIRPRAARVPDMTHAPEPEEKCTRPDPRWQRRRVDPFLLFPPSIEPPSNHTYHSQGVGYYVVCIIMYIQVHTKVANQAEQNTLIILFKCYIICYYYYSSNSDKSNKNNTFTVVKVSLPSFKRYFMCLGPVVPKTKSVFQDQWTHRHYQGAMEGLNPQTILAPQVYIFIFSIS